VRELRAKGFTGAVPLVDEPAVRERRLEWRSPAAVASAAVADAPRVAEATLQLAAHAGARKVPPLFVLVPSEQLREVALGSAAGTGAGAGAGARARDLTAAVLNLGQDVRRSRPTKFKLIALCQGEDRARPCRSGNSAAHQSSQAWVALDVKLSQESLARMLPAQFLGLRLLRASLVLANHSRPAPFPCPSQLPGLGALTGADALSLLEAAFFEHRFERAQREGRSAEQSEHKSAAGPDLCAIILKAVADASANARAPHSAGLDFVFANAVNKLNYALNDSLGTLYKLLGRGFDFGSRSNLEPVVRLTNGQTHWVCAEHAHDRRYSAVADKDKGKE
jgi:hypothetical protein